MEVTYALDFSPKALRDVQYFKKLGDKVLIRKIDQLLSELEQHPLIGTGRPEILRFELTGFMSRRINGEHRLVYRIVEENKVIEVISLKGHY